MSREPVLLQLTNRSKRLPVLVDINRLKVAEAHSEGGSILYLRGMAPIIVAETPADIVVLIGKEAASAAGRGLTVANDSDASLTGAVANDSASGGLTATVEPGLHPLIWVVHHVDENSAAGAFASEQGAIDHLAESGQTPDQDEPLWYERLEVFP